MKKLSSRILAVVLSVVLAVSVLPVAFAANTTSIESYISRANLGSVVKTLLPNMNARKTNYLPSVLKLAFQLVPALTDQATKDGVTDIPNASTEQLAKSVINLINGALAAADLDSNLTVLDSAIPNTSITIRRVIKDLGINIKGLNNVDDLLTTLTSLLFAQNDKGLQITLVTLYTGDIARLNEDALVRTAGKKTQLGDLVTVRTQPKAYQTTDNVTAPCTDILYALIGFLSDNANVIGDIITRGLDLGNQTTGLGNILTNVANINVNETVNGLLDKIPTMVKEAIYNGVLAPRDDDGNRTLAYEDSEYYKNGYTADSLITSFIINTSNEAPWGTVVPKAEADAAANMTVKALFDKYISGFLNHYLSKVLQGLVGGINDLLADPAADFGFLAGNVFDTSAAFTTSTFDSVDEVSIPKIVKVILQTLLSDKAEAAIGLGDDINENLTKTLRYVLGQIANDNGGKHTWDGFESDLSAYAATYNSVSAEVAAVKIASLFMPFAFNENAPETEELEKLLTWIVYKALTGANWMKDAITAAIPDVESKILSGSAFVDQSEKGYWFDVVFDMLLAVAEDALDKDSSDMHFNYTSDTSGGNWVNKLDNIVDWAFNYVDGLPAIADKVTNTANVYDGYGPFYKADVVLNNLLPLDFINADDATFKGSNFDLETFILLKLLPAVTDLDLNSVVDLLDFNAKPFNQKLGAAAAEIVDTLLTRLFSFTAGGSANFARNATNWTPLVEGSYDTTHGYYKSAKLETHTWGAYKDDNASSGADGTHTRACTYDASHTESAPHRYDDGKVTTAATCTTDSISTFTCLDCGHKYTVTNAGTAIGHKWGEPTYKWASDNSSVTATRVCANDKSHVETETVAAAAATTAPTCTAAGKTVYTSAAFANAAFAVQTKTVDIAATGHNWGEWKSADAKTHTRVCANDKSHVETADHNFKATVTTEPTATTAGVRTYTCSDCGFAYTESIDLVETGTGMDGFSAVAGKDYPSNVSVSASAVTSGELYDLAKGEYSNFSVASVNTSKSGSGKVWAKIALADGVKAEDVKVYTAEVKETGSFLNRKKVLSTNALSVTAGDGVVYVELPSGSANLLITGNNPSTQPEPPVTEPTTAEPSTEPTTQTPPTEPTTQTPPTEPTTAPTTVPPVTEPPVTEPAKIELEIVDEKASKSEVEGKLIVITASVYTLDTLKAAIGNTPDEYTVTKPDGSEFAADEAVGTGAIITLNDADKTQYVFVLMGDADGSGSVNATDARAVLRAAAKLDTLDPDKSVAADVTGDNKIDATDARLVLRVSAKLESIDGVPELYKK